MAPLSKEISPIRNMTPPHLGPATPEVNSEWFKLFIYFVTGYGPPTILLSKGSRLRLLPKLLKNFSKVLVTTWGHDPTVLPITNVMFTLNEALCHSPVLLQGYGESNLVKRVIVPFPISDAADSEMDWSRHPAIKKLSEVIDLKHNCGFLTMVHLNQGDLNQCNSYFKEVNNYFESNNSMVNSWIDSQVINKEESQVPSPVNGLTNQNFASLLEEELNNLEKNKMESSKEKSMNERRENKIDKELSGWTLLDCDFGIPLFNATTNEQVCKAICDHKLWAKSR